MRGSHLYILLQLLRIKFIFTLNIGCFSFFCFLFSRSSRLMCIII